MELPDAWSDLVNQNGTACYPIGYQVPPNQPTNVPSTNRPPIAPPSLWLSYLRKFSTIIAANQAIATSTGHATGPCDGTINPFVINGNTFTPTQKYQGAELLYMIATTGVSDELDDRDQFKQEEIGDVDQDGAPEFIDGWGQPIYFIRWAPGFTSELQTHNDPDQFDSRNIYPSVTGNAGAGQLYPATSTQITPTFALYPFIFSGGPDKSYGIDKQTFFSYADHNNDPFSSVWVLGATNSFGTPYDTDNLYGGGNTNAACIDNIHNHLITAR
jgi:hypothetical protein